MPWTDAIALRGRGSPLSVLPPASELGDGPSLVSFEQVPLAMPVDDYARRDPYPLPTTDDREGYQGNRHRDYWLNGLRDYLLLLQRLAEHNVQLAAKDRIVDLGCASGRVLRHFACQLAADREAELDLWGIDVNLSHIEWIESYLPPWLKALQNHALPHLPLEDRSVKLLYGFSVFTHVDEFELAWLAELRRVLAPGGVAYLTIHSDRTWAKMTERDPIYQALMQMQHTASGAPITRAVLAAPFSGGRASFVARGIDRVYDKNVFHSTAYIQRAWGRFLEIEQIWPAGAGYQDVVLLRRPFA